MSNLCLQCQYENRETARFCAECGAALDDIEPRTFSVVAEEAGDSREELDETEFECLDEQIWHRQRVGAQYLVVGQRSDVGATRRGQANEDSLFVLTATAISSSQAGPTVGLYLVADGMGGHMDGELASRTACEIVAEHLLAALGLPALAAYSPDSVLQQIADALQSANRQIYETAAANGSNMGTTAVLAVVVDDQAYLAHVGDSRAYLWRASELQQLTEDHSHVYTLFTNGLIEEEAIYSHPRRNEIFRSLGAAPAVEVSCSQTDLAPDDLLLLCSDGLWEMLRSEGIADVLELNLGDPQVICDELVRRANLAGGDDNISVIVVRAIG